MKAEVVLGHSYRLKATPRAGVEVLAVAKRAFGLGRLPWGASIGEAYRVPYPFSEGGN